MPTFIKTYITMHHSINSNTFKKKFIPHSKRAGKVINFYIKMEFGGIF